MWFYEVTGDGFTLDDKRLPDPEHDNLKNLSEAFLKKEETAHSWFAPREQLIAEEYNLTASRYKPITAEQTHHRDPKEIIGEVLALETEIAEGLDKLRKKL